MTEQERDYRSLEVQYTDLNRLWMAQGREITALRAELQTLADTARLACRFSDDDSMRALRRQVDEANKLLNGEG